MLTHLCFSVIGSRLIKLLIQLEFDFCGLKCALRFHGDDALVIHAKQQVWLDKVPHLARGKTHT